MHYTCYLGNTTVEERYRQHCYVLPSYDSKSSPRLQDTACVHSITTIMCFTTYAELEYDVIIQYASVVHKLGYEHQNILNVRIWQLS